MIKFYDMQSINYESIEDLCSASDRIIRSGNYVFGTDKFEEEFADYNGNKNCIGVSSGTSALHIALMALGIGPGDEVITVSHTFRATVSAIKYCNATPVFVDINPETYLIDANKIESKITSKTKAIIPVHLYGNVCDMDTITKIASNYNLSIVEDCSQAHGSEYNGKKVGTFGQFGTFSFYPGKGLGALGDAGCIVTNDKDLADKAMQLRSWDDVSVGFNYRMSNLQAEFLRIKLKRYPDVLKQKIEIANYYNTAFNFCKTQPGVKHSYHIYPILVKDRQKIQNSIKEKVETKVHYPIPVHRYSSFANGVSLPVTERIANTVLSLPIYPGVDAKTVVETLSKIL